jgi:quinoprotein glucose dehydrogenase
MKTIVLPSLLLFSLGSHAATERITPDNIHRLTVAWTYDTRDSVKPIGRGGDPPAFEATPVYSAGRVYLSTPQGTVAALDAETGREIWRIDLAVRRDAYYSDPANRGPALRGDSLYVGTIDARLVCLRVSDGRRCPRFGQNGEIDLAHGLRQPPEWAGEYALTSPPAVYRDLIVVGSSVADNSRTRMASGEVRAFDATTGALRWTFHPLRESSGSGGANAWSRIVVDEARHLLFVPTGSPSPDYFGGLRPGNNEYANSIVALKAGSGEVAWHFQTVHHDLWDYDVATPPLLFSLQRDGARPVPAVAVAPKAGNLFLFDRVSGAPLFPIAERAVPSSDIPGEAASPTQPFPSKPAALALQHIAESDIWGATAEDRDACLRTFRTLRNEGVFTPPSVRGTLQAPGNIGGLHWGGMAWDPLHRLIVAPINRLPAITRVIPQAEFSAAKKAFPSRETTEQRGAPYAMSREFFLAPSGAPCVAPPWGELVAVHAESGEIAWRAPLGDLRKYGLGTPDSPTGSPNLGGPATTDTGLVFIGAAFDPYLRAFDTSTGREVWKGSLPTSARATPLVFQTASGRRMIAIAAGGHDHPMSRMDTKLVVFALASPSR